MPRTADMAISTIGDIFFLNIALEPKNNIERITVIIGAKKSAVWRNTGIILFCKIMNKNKITHIANISFKMIYVEAHIPL